MEDTHRMKENTKKQLLNDIMATQERLDIKVDRLLQELQQTNARLDGFELATATGEHQIMMDTTPKKARVAFSEEEMRVAQSLADNGMAQKVITAGLGRAGGTVSTVCRRASEKSKGLAPMPFLEAIELFNGYREAQGVTSNA